MAPLCGPCADHGKGRKGLATPKKEMTIFDQFLSPAEILNFCLDFINLPSHGSVYHGSTLWTMRRPWEREEGAGNPEKRHDHLWSICSSAEIWNFCPDLFHLLSHGSVYHGSTMWTMRRPWESEGGAGNPEKRYDHFGQFFIRQ